MNKQAILLQLHLEHDSYQSLSTLGREHNRVSHDAIMKAYNRLWLIGGHNHIRLTDKELIAEKQLQDKHDSVDAKIAVIRKKQDDKFHKAYAKQQDAKLVRYAMAEKELFSLFGI